MGEFIRQGQAHGKYDTYIFYRLGYIKLYVKSRQKGQEKCKSYYISSYFIYLQAV
jgi:hypothetical protein